MIGLALLEIRLDRNAEAERLLLEAARYLQQFGAVANGAFGPEVRDALLYMINSHIGWLYYRQGRYAEAEAILTETLRGLGANRAADWLNAMVIPVLADLYIAQGSLAEAEALLRRGVAAEERAAATAVTEAHGIAGRTDNVMVSYLVSLANIQSRQGRYAEAMPLYERAASAAERTLGPSHDQTLSSRLALADVLARQQRDAAAEAIYAQVLSLARERFGAQHVLALRAAEGLARTRLAQPAKANAAVDEARSLAQAWRARLGAGDRDEIGRGEAEREADLRRSAFGLFANAAWLPASASPQAMERLRGEAFLALQDAMTDPSSGAMALAAARRAADQAESGLGALARDRESLAERLSANITAMSQTFETIGGDGATRRVELATERSRIETMIRSIDARMRSEFPSYFSLVRPAAVTIEEVQARLGPDDAMLVVLPTDAGTHSLAVTRQGATWVRSEWAIEQVDAAVQRLRWDLGARVTAPVELRRAWQEEERDCTARPFHRGLAHQLYREIFANLEPLLAGKRRLFVVAGGPLAGLPFAVLTTAPGQGSDSDASALRATSWLADRFAMVTLPTVEALGSRQATPAAAVSTGAAFAGFGDPLLLGSPQLANCGRATAAPTEGSARSASRSGANATNARMLKGLSRLAGTSVELDNMRRAFGAPAGALHLADRATEAAVRTADLSHTRVIAFATHGLVGDELSSLAEPGLVFTPPAVGSEEDDGYLAASEVAGLRLDADWVILSACNTATGAQSQSLSALSRAFFHAGARALLASHWEVDDEVSARLTVRTVEIERTGADRASAFQQAMREIRMDASHDRPEASWAHPAYWAPFVLIGNGTG